MIYLKIPTHCPICGGDTTIKNNDGVETLWCTNPSCEGKLVNKIDHFVGKKGLDIKGLSKATIEKLMDWGWLNSIKDVFTLSTFAREWKNKSGFGEKSVNNILAAIESAKQTTLDKFIAGLGISLIGGRVSKVLAENFKTWGNFMFAVDNFDFEDLDGFGPEMNRALKEFDYTEAEEIVKLLTFKTEEVKEVNKSVVGLTFVITGKLSRKRSDIQTDIEAAGGKVASSVSGKTNYLVCNQPEDTTKYHKAVQLNIPIITEVELMGMING